VTVLLLGILSALILVGATLGVPIFLKTTATQALAQHLGRAVTIGQVQFNPLTLTLTLDNGIIGPRLADPTDTVDPAFAFSRLRVDLDRRSLWQRALVCQELSLLQPYLHLVRPKEGGDPLTALLSRLAEGQPAGQYRLAPWLVVGLPRRYSINNIAISQGEILVDDPSAASGLHVEQLSLSLPSVANISYQSGQIAPLFSALVNGTPIHTEGQAQGVGGQMTASLSLALTGINLAPYHDLLPARLGLHALSGQSDLELTWRYRAAALPANRVHLAGGLTLRQVTMANDYGQFQLDSGLVKGEVNPISRQVEVEEITLHHPLWQAHGGAEPLDLGKFLLASLGEGVRLPVGELQIIGGEIREPPRPGGEAAKGWQAIEVSIKTAQVSAGGEGQQQAIFTVNAKQQGGSRLSVQGSASTVPFAAKGLVVINHLDIPTAQALWQGLGGRAALPVTAGLIEQIQANFNLSLAAGQQPQWQLDPLSLQAKDLRLEHGGQRLEVPVWQSEQGAILPNDTTLHLGRVQMQQAQVSCRRQSRDASWQGLFPAPETLPVDVSGLELTNSSLLIENQGPPDISLRLQRFDLQIDPFLPQQENTVTAAALLSDKYPLQATGTFSLNPFSASLKIGASDLPLAEFQPVLARYFAAPAGGTLSAEGTLALPSLDYRGQWEIDSFSLPPWRCRHLTAEGTRFTLRPLAMNIDRLHLQGPALEVTANANGMPQLPQILQPGWQPAAREGEAAVSVKSVEFDDGALLYQLPAGGEEGGKRMTLGLSELTGSLDSLAAVQGQATPFTLTGRVGDQADLSAQGVVRPFASPFGLEMKGAIKGLPVSALAPILEPYSGFALRSGTLDLANNLVYEGSLIQDSLQASWHDLVLGKPLSAEDGPWQHLLLLQALLQDPSSTIAMTVPIDGRTDTGFTYQTAIKAFFSQLLLKTAISPMNLVDEQHKAVWETVFFAAGKSQVSPEGEEGLQALAALLQVHPLLAVHLVGFADSVRDGKALRQAKKDSQGAKGGEGGGGEGDKALLDLARERAEAVQGLLNRYGVTPGQILVDESEVVADQTMGHSGCRVGLRFGTQEG